ncbi:MAG: hypothetical protein FJ137_09910 [Deltaproteobacteria bacterium]|nr:hypothetical protein [Deltaproteobacteria bacterium]
MSQFADFALLASLPSYGGAKILLAQRVLPGGPGPRVHLAMFGRSEPIARRVVAVATAAAQLQHPALARIHEVALFDGVVFGVSDPAEGVDLASLLVAEKARRRTPAIEVAVGVALSVARVIVALHETGDAWAADSRGAAGLATVFPGGLSPDLLFLDPQTGGVRLRLLASAAGDPAAPSTYRAPEGRPSMAGDVYSLGRLLMGLLAGDPHGLEVPRLASSSMIRFLPRLIDQRPDDRPTLADVVERLEAAMNELHTTPEQAVQAAVNGPYKHLVVDAMPGLEVPPHVVDEIRMRLPWTYGAVQRLFPSMAGMPGGNPMMGMMGGMMGMPGNPMMGGPMMGGPMMGGPMMGGPMMGGPMMGGPMLGGPMMGGPMLGGPMMGGPMMGGPMLGGPMLGGPMMGGPMALPAPQGAMPLTSEEGGAVFTDARPAEPKKRSGKTNPTMMIPDAKALLKPLPGGAAATVSIDDAYVVGRAEPQHTVMIDPSQFVPFQPAVPGAPWSPATFQPPPPPPPAKALLAAPSTPPSIPPLLGHGATVRPAPPSPSALSSPDVRLGTTVNAVLANQAAGVSAPAATALGASRSDSALVGALAGELDDDHDDEEEAAEEEHEDDERTMIAEQSSPPPPPPRPEPFPAPPQRQSPIDVSGAIDVDFDDERDARPRDDARNDLDDFDDENDDLDADSAADPLDADADLVDVAGESFQMIGDAGRTFDESDNPFRRATRMVPQQALQKPREPTLPSAESSVDGYDDDSGATEMVTPERVAALAQGRRRDPVTPAAPPPSMLLPPPAAPPRRATPPASTRSTGQPAVTARVDVDDDDGATQMVSPERMAALMRGAPSIGAPAPPASAAPSAAPSATTGAKTGRWPTSPAVAAVPSIIVEDDGASEEGGATQMVSPERLAEIMRSRRDEPERGPAPTTPIPPAAAARDNPRDAVRSDADLDDPAGATQMVSAERLAEIRRSGSRAADDPAAPPPAPRPETPPAGTSPAGTPRAGPPRPGTPSRGTPRASGGDPTPATTRPSTAAGTGPRPAATATPSTKPEAARPAAAPPATSAPPSSGAGAGPARPSSTTAPSAAKTPRAPSAGAPPPPPSSATAAAAPAPSRTGTTSLTIEAPDGARVLVNGTEVGIGRVVVDVAAGSRAIVKVMHAAYAPWSSVVEMGGRAKLRVRPQLKPKT